MPKTISSISFSDLIWTGFNENRISFYIIGIDGKLHFTVSSHEKDQYVNLHITKNVANQIYKPKITIVKAEKTAMQEIMEIVAKAFFVKKFKPIHFRNYSRRARKRMRILFLDNFEEQPIFNVIEKKPTESYHRHSKIKNGRLKINEQITEEMAVFARSKQWQHQVLNCLKVVNKKSFNGNQFRGGILILGAQSMPFISRNNNCYILQKGIQIENFLQTFMKPELVSILMNNCRNAISIIKEAKTYADTKPYDIPIVLYVEKPTQPATIG